MEMNYNDENEIFKKGSVLLGSGEGDTVSTWQTESAEEEKHLRKRNITILHCDIIKDDFWEAHPNLLKPLKDVKKFKKIKLDK